MYLASNNDILCTVILILCDICWESNHLVAIQGYLNLEIEPIIVIISFSVFIAYLFCWTSNLYLLMDAAYKDTFSVYYTTRVIQ